MKKFCLVLLLSISFGSPLLICMEKEEETFESELFLTPQQVFDQADPLPEEYKSTGEWIAERSDFFKSLQMPKMSNDNEMASYYHKVLQAFYHTVLQALPSPSLSVNNYIFDTDLAQTDPDHQTVVRYAGRANTLASLASSAGIDSGLEQNMWESVQTPFGHRQYKADALEKATHGNFTVHQHTSMLAYYLMMKKRLKGKVQPVQTWAVRFGDGEEFCDRNYVIVQPKNPETYVRVDQMPHSARFTALDKGLLPDLADAVDAGAWNLTQENLWYDVTSKNFYITDLEKPNNEGWGPNPGTNPRWGTAVFSYKGDGTSSHPWKREHNIRCGYDSVRGIVLESRSDLQQEWDKLKEERAPKE